MTKWIFPICLIGAVSAQTFETSGRLVVVDVMVRNPQGVIRELTKDDFTLLDKGKKQELALFEITEAGSAGTQPIDMNPMIGSNRFNSKGELQRTATILLYDRVNSVAENQAFIRAQVLRALALLKDTDRVGFYSLGFELKMVHDFSEDAAPLARMAKRMLAENASPEGLTGADRALWDRLSDALTPMQQLANQAKVNITYPAFRAVAHRLAGVPGRKNLLWITSTFPLTFGNSPERRNDDEKEVSTFEQTLMDHNIVVFPIDPGGTGAALQTPSQMSTEGGLLRQNGTPVMQVQMASSQTSNQTMMRITSNTGGRAFRNENDIEPFLREVMQEEEYTYTLGFIPEEKSLDGTKHKLEVKLNKKLPGKVTISHRKQYVAWGPKKAPELAQRPSMGELFQQKINASGIGLIGVANPDPAKPQTFQLDVRIGVEDLRLSPVGEKFVGAFDMAVALEGEESKGAAVETLNLEWTAAQYQQAIGGGLVISKPVTTNTNKGTFHVVVQDKVTGLGGAVRVPFDRPVAPPAAAPAK